MKYIKSLEQFINESNNISVPHKLQILMRGTIGLTSKTEAFTVELMQKIYDKYVHLVLIKLNGDYNRSEKIPANRRFNEFIPSIPILNFTSKYHKFLSIASKVFNKVEDIAISASKVKFHKEFNDFPFMPKTVFSIKDIEKLSLPIIAKPSDGFSAQGIEVFNSYEDARNSDREFDLWSEKKDIKTEFRAYIMNKKIIHITQRINNTKNDKSVDVKDPDEKIDLVYIDQDMDKFPYMDDINNILNDILTKVKLDFFCIDLMLDVDGKLWVPEINSGPGLSPSLIYPIYKSWLKMAYGINIDKNSGEELQRWANEHRKYMKDAHPDEYKSSAAPIEPK